MAPRATKHLSAKHRRKISEGRIRGFLRDREQRVAEPDQRRCSHCKRYRPLTEFAVCKKKLRSGEISVLPDGWCRPCRAKAAKVRYHRKKAEGLITAESRRRKYEAEDPVKRRERWRAGSAARRREEGRPRRGSRKPISQNREYVPIGPLVSLLDKVEIPEGVFPPSVVRRVYAVTSGEQQRVSLGVVDQILLGLECHELLDELYPTSGLAPYEYLPGS